MKRLLLAFLGICVCLSMCGALRMANQVSFTPDGSIVRFLDASGRTFCSGTVISDKIIITAAHCVIVETMIGPVVLQDIVVSSASKLTKSVANVVTASSQTDQAVLTGNFRMFPSRGVITSPEQDMAATKTDKVLISCGYPLGGDLYCTEFVVTGHEIFWISGYSNMFPGMSGGPAIDPDTGLVVGINYAAHNNQDLITPTLEILANVDQSKL